MDNKLMNKGSLESLETARSWYLLKYISKGGSSRITLLGRAHS